MNDRVDERGRTKKRELDWTVDLMSRLPPPLQTRGKYSFIPNNLHLKINIRWIHALASTLSEPKRERRGEERECIAPAPIEWNIDYEELYQRWETVHSGSASRSGFLFSLLFLFFSYFSCFAAVQDTSHSTSDLLSSMQPSSYLSSSALLWVTIHLMWLWPYPVTFKPQGSNCQKRRHA